MHIKWMTNVFQSCNISRNHSPTLPKISLRQSSHQCCDQNVKNCCVSRIVTQSRTQSVTLWPNVYFKSDLEWFTVGTCGCSGQILSIDLSGFGNFFVFLGIPVFRCIKESRAPSVTCSVGWSVDLSIIFVFFSFA